MAPLRVDLVVYRATLQKCVFVLPTAWEQKKTLEKNIWFMTEEFKDISRFSITDYSAFVFYVLEKKPNVFIHNFCAQKTAKKTVLLKAV